jgi:hypothetical protein
VSPFELVPELALARAVVTGLALLEPLAWAAPEKASAAVNASVAGRMEEREIMVQLSSGRQAFDRAASDSSDTDRGVPKV